jgi:short-subunit dehydrogenase
VSAPSAPSGEHASRPALILGAGSGIARAIAAEFAARGHPVLLAARDPAAIERDRADLALRFGVEATAHRFDALETESFETFLDGLPRTPRIVVCAVGAMDDQDAAARDPARAAHVIAVNFTGPALILEAAARRLAALEEPTAVIGIGSVAGDRGRAKNYVYGAAKAAFAEWLSGMRQKYSGSQLHVMTVKPGFVATAMTEGMDLPERLTAQPEEVGAAVVRAVRARRDVIYVRPVWRIVMAIIRAIPEPLFKKMKI